MRRVDLLFNPRRADSRRTRTAVLQTFVSLGRRCGRHHAVQDPAGHLRSHLRQLRRTESLLRSKSDDACGRAHTPRRDRLPRVRLPDRRQVLVAPSSAERFAIRPNRAASLRATERAHHQGRPSAQENACVLSPAFVIPIKKRRYVAARWLSGSPRGLDHRLDSWRRNRWNDRDQVRHAPFSSERS